MLLNPGADCGCCGGVGFTCSCLPTGTDRPSIHFSGYSPFAAAWFERELVWSNSLNRWVDLTSGFPPPVNAGEWICNPGPPAPGMIWFPRSGGNVGFVSSSNTVFTCSPFTMHYTGETVSGFNQIILTM